MVDVVVIGGANMDIKAKAAAVHVSGTSNPGLISTMPGGVGRNIAHNLARLGASVALVGAVGDDHHGEAVRAATKAAGVDVSHLETLKASTGTYLAVLDHNGELVTAINDMRIVDAIKPGAIAAAKSLIKKARFVVVDCNLPLETLQAVAAIAASKLLVEPVSVPKSTKLKALLQSEKIFLATPNRDQLHSLTGTRNCDKGVAALHAMGLRNVIVHAGVVGAYASSGVGVVHVPSHALAPVVDVTGAGDAAVAGLVYGLLQEEALDVAAARGQRLAGQVVSSPLSTLE